MRINALIKASAWSDLNLPTPEALTAMLLSGEGTTIEQHFVVYDSDDDVTWYTNPYGVDGALFDRPTVERVRSFLADMARGFAYGPTPDRRGAARKTPAGAGNKEIGATMSKRKTSAGDWMPMCAEHMTPRVASLYR
ncbi:TPA: hypothetical protein QDA94_004183 [Burkholderia vietnamiensis]|uniref:hypothetical protein n=1 Tax=Burkholderia cepacia complex TaxID=87882 RepID=UPI0015940501|nr:MULTISPECIES: hypothetical protein [Burkholderia cepacia complex]MBU9658325.1 hypothetical protein [Burkholderia cenocepacia]HDR8918774.1 hypothetical protein [Burkholderia vietnamiensis]HDR8976965.1 hypothetical protein [Burkholderia vietnamiensis]HDR9049925.1 hypothetical protein [Burkholderia vietnamiensis]HDR9191195.1 hypothetical protein [Burkholderia vietnamiensis]